MRTFCTTTTSCTGVAATCLIETVPCSRCTRLRQRCVYSRVKQRQVTAVGGATAVQSAKSSQEPEPERPHALQRQRVVCSARTYARPQTGDNLDLLESIVDAPPVVDVADLATLDVEWLQQNDAPAETQLAVRSTANDRAASSHRLLASLFCAHVKLVFVGSYCGKCELPGCLPCLPCRQDSMHWWTAMVSAFT